MSSAPPEKRLVFFSTNPVSKMPLKIKQLADQQGAMTEFPNFDREITTSLFRLYLLEVLVGSRAWTAAVRSAGRMSD